jgi:hypothetical protein
MARKMENRKGAAEKKRKEKAGPSELGMTSHIKGK